MMHHRRPPHVVLLPLLLLHIARSVVLADLSIPVPESIPCMKPCEDKADISNVPLCAINPSTTTDSGLSNTLSCLCTDRHLLASTIPCILQSCATNSSAIETYFTHLYTICHTHGHTEYPPPPHLLRSLGIEPPPRVLIPSRIAGVPEGASFPEPAASAGAPTALPTGAHFINKLAAEAAPRERGSVGGGGAGETSGSARGVEVGHGMGFSGAGVVGVAVVGVVVVAVLVVF